MQLITDRFGVLCLAQFHIVWSKRQNEKAGGFCEQNIVLATDISMQTSN